MHLLENKPQINADEHRLIASFYKVWYKNAYDHNSIPPASCAYRHERKHRRVDGSIGITLDEPVIKISAKKSDIVEITGESEHSEAHE